MTQTTTLDELVGKFEALLTDRKRRVTSGKWLAPYTGTVVTDPSNLDIDHMVPLGNANASVA